MPIKKRKEKKLGSYKIHNFIDKLRQGKMIGKLKDYAKWRVKLSRGEKAAPPRSLAPASINLDLTTACNFDCAHCIDTYVRAKGGKFLPLEKIKALIDYWAERGLRSVIVIGGGEPVVYPEFEKAIEFLKSKRLQLGIVTNGSNMKRIARIAHLLGRKDWVRVSMDAASDEMFQKIHAPKTRVNYDEILAEVKAIRKKYKKFQMGFSFLVVSEEHGLDNGAANNISEIPLAVKKARDNGFTYFSLKPYISSSGQRPTYFGKETVAFIRKQIALAKKYETAKFRIKESLNLLALFDGSHRDLVVHPKVCHSQAFRLVADPDGIYNCTLWRGFGESRIADFSGPLGKEFFGRFDKSFVERIDNFDATEKCNETSCIYNELNWFIEDLIRHPEKLKRLKGGKDFEDYFL